MAGPTKAAIRRAGFRPPETLSDMVRRAEGLLLSEKQLAQESQHHAVEFPRPLKGCEVADAGE